MTTTPLGTVLRDVDGVRLEFTRSYDASAEEVWSALTDPDRTARWLGRWTGDPASGAVELVMAAEEDAPAERVTIDACEPPHRLAVTVGTADGPWPLVVTLAEEGRGTALRFVHHLAEPYDASSLGPGWHFYLDRLAAALVEQPVPDRFEDYHPAPEGAYAVPDAPAAR